MHPLHPPTGRPSSLVSALRLLRERWWIPLICFVLAVVVAVALDKRKTKLYEASATLLFGSTATNATGVLNPGASSVSNDPQRDQGTTLVLVTSSTVAERVKQTLRLPESVDQLIGKVTVTAQSDANLVDVTASDPNPVRAARIADGFADQYKIFRRNSDRSGLAQGIADLQGQLAKVPPTDVAGRQVIQNALSQLNITQAASTGGVQVVNRATPAGAPFYPRTKRDAVLGGLLGLALGAVIAFAVDLFDRRLKTVTDFEEAYDLPAMTAIPYERSEPRNERQRVAALEPLRILRSGLDLIGRGEHVEVVLVTSAVTGEGKSRTAAGLARAIALSGRRVALLEVDLRRPTFHRRFALLDDERGLSNALLDGVSVEELLRRPDAALPTLEVLPAGRIPPRSAELLGGERMTQLLERLRERCDVVVLDAPPLLPVADTRVLLDMRAIDACLVIGRAYHTTRDQAGRAHSILRQHRVRDVGLVVNGLRRAESRYEYGSEYLSEAAPPPWDPDPTVTPSA